MQDRHSVALRDAVSESDGAWQGLPMREAGLWLDDRP